MSSFFYTVEGFLERKLRLNSLIAVTVFACGGLQAGHAAAATCYADSVTTLQDCLDDAEDDDGNWHEIQLKEGTYQLTSQLTLTKGKVRLVGAGRVSHDPSDGKAGEPYSAEMERISDRKALNRAKYFVLDGQNQTRIFKAVDESENLILYVQGLTFKNGNPPATDNEGGGGLWFKGKKMIIESSIFTGNSDSALRHYAQDLQSISDSHFYNNTGEYSTTQVCPDSGSTSKYWGGALTSDGSDFGIGNTTFENNRGCRGGAIYTEAETRLYGSTVSNNEAYRGGGVYIAKNTFTQTTGTSNSTIYGNQASDSGGGLYIEQGTSRTWQFYATILAGNSAPAENGAFSDCYRGAGIDNYPDFVQENILGHIGVGKSVGDCSPLLNPPGSNQPTGVSNPELEELAYNGSIGLQLKTHLPKASSISLDVVDVGFGGMCEDQRSRLNMIAPSLQNTCAAGATQRIQQVNGTWGGGEAPFMYSSAYKIVLTENQNIQIDLASNEEDVRLILEDANKNEIEDTDDHASPISSNARITKQLNAGVYYISAMIGGSWGYLDSDLLADYFLSVNAEVELTPDLVFIDNAEVAGRPTLGQTGSVLWERQQYGRPPGTSGLHWYKMDSSTPNDVAIFESDYFDPADTTLYFKYRINGAHSGSLFVDVELDGVWDLDHWVRRSSNPSDVSPDWQQASYDLSGLASQGYDKVRIRLYGWQDQYLHSNHYLLLDDIVIFRYMNWYY